AAAFVQVNGGGSSRDADGPHLLGGVGARRIRSGEGEGAAGQVEGGAAAEAIVGVDGTVIDQQRAARVDGDGADGRGGAGAVEGHRGAIVDHDAAGTQGAGGGAGHGAAARGQRAAEVAAAAARTEDQ